MAQKTPVSLMNELAKANQVHPEYKVTEESGPAHKRTFTVQLSLGELGTWVGKANTIRGAKHVAANAGLEKCGLCMPRAEKPEVKQVYVTPTVELNVLAMKLGKLTKYEELPYKSPVYHPAVNMGYQGLHIQHQMTGTHHGGHPRSRSSYGMLHPYPGQGSHYRPYFHNGYQPRSAPPRIPRITCVKLIVGEGEHEFYGEGRDKQAARKNAAAKAVRVMREEVAAAGQRGELKKPVELEAVAQSGEESMVSQPEISQKSTTADFKSEVSKVYEIASKHKLQVGFEEKSSSGPPHMKRFVVSVTVGEFVTEGEGCKKKDARREAAKKMLEKLKQLPPVADLNHKKPGLFIHRGPRLSYVKKPKGDIDPSLSPVTILQQIFQRRHEQYPVYELLREEKSGQEREFTMQVTTGPHTAKGEGPNKKEAKKKAAEAMLQLIGFRSAEGQSAKIAQGDKPVGMEKTDAEQKGPFKSASSSSQPATILGRQLKPGLLPMVPELAKQTRLDIMNSVVAPIAQVKQEAQEPILQCGLNRAPGAPVVKAAAPPLTAVQKLLHLAEVEGFQVQFTDYPKEREFLTLVTVSSIPPLTCYGSGVTAEAAREEAAAIALKPLLQLGLDRSSTLKSFEEGKVCSSGGLLSQPTNDVTASDDGRESQPKKDICDVCSAGDI